MLHFSVYPLPKCLWATKLNDANKEQCSRHRLRSRWRAQIKWEFILMWHKVYHGLYLMPSAMHTCIILYERVHKFTVSVRAAFKSMHQHLFEFTQKLWDRRRKKLENRCEEKKKKFYKQCGSLCRVSVYALRVHCIVIAIVYHGLRASYILLHCLHIYVCDWLVVRLLINTQGEKESWPTIVIALLLKVLVCVQFDANMIWFQ